MNVVIAPVDSAHEPALHAINRASPITAGATFVVEREPDFFAWPRATFRRYQYFGIFAERELVGYLIAGAQRGWTGREHRDFCYIGDARVTPRARGKGLTAIAAEQVRAAQSDDVDIGFCFVKKRNARGQRALRSLAKTALPVAYDGAYAVFDIPSGQGTDRGVAGVRVARPADATEIAQLLEREYAGRMFAPRVDRLREDLGIDLLWGYDRVWVAERRGRVTGVLAARDASCLRVTRVVSYGVRARVAAAIRRAARIARAIPNLPRAGGAIRPLTTTHLAVADDDPTIARALIDAARAHAARAGFHGVRVGFVGNDRLSAAVRGTGARKHDGQLHLFAHTRSRLDAALACASRPYVNLLAI